MQSLLFGALLSAREPQWRPAAALQERWTRIAVALLGEPRAVRLGTVAAPKGAPATFGDTSGARPKHSLCSVLLEQAGAMGGDKGIFRLVATHQRARRLALVTSKFRPETIRFPDYAVDQHTHADIALLLHEPGAVGHGGTKQQPFKGTLAKLFEEVTGRNPRRGALFEETVWEAKVLQAQAAIRRQALQPAPCPEHQQQQNFSSSSSISSSSDGDVVKHETLAFEIPAGHLSGRRDRDRCKSTRE